MSEELKPCPFCGETDIRTGGDEDHAYAYCMKCGCEGPYGDFTDAQAIQAWNTRANQ